MVVQHLQDKVVKVDDNNKALISQSFFYYGFE